MESLICVNNEGFERFLTKGATYSNRAQNYVHLKGVKTLIVQVMNDSGEYGYYDKNRVFIVMPEKAL